jgi:ATP-dependent DNA helicase PIF1
VRKSKLPFGGIQLVLVGDFLQLPPVTKVGEERVYAFQATSWRRCVQATMELHQIHRQADPLFCGLLRRLRQGRCSAEDAALIRSTASHRIEIDGIVATKLCTHVFEAEDINKQALARLGGASRLFAAKDSEEGEGGAVRELLSRCCRAPEKIELKVGAQVMLIKNLNVGGGLANGSRGVVKRFDGNGLPVVAVRRGVGGVFR